MHNIVKCWWYKEDFLDNFDPDEVIYIDNFDITDVYLYSIYKDFEIIEVNIVEGIAPEYCNCEGCVNFGNEECEHLCALTHRFSTY